MKTFTNYAEKKVKQFLNLLHGYTKGIRMTAILILLLMGVSNAWGETVLFLKNTIPFNNGRYAYFYTSPYWDNSNGAGSNGIASQCNSMTKLGWDGQSDIYVYQTISNYKYVAIMDHSQNNYGNFWETQGCAATYDNCDGLYDIKKPMMIPTSTNPFKKNQDKTQYYHFSWDVPTVWIKHPFGGGTWSYKQMTYNNDGTFSVDAEYSNGNGCDYGCQNNDNGKGGYIEQPIKTPNNTWSHLARFKMTFSGGSVKISITKLCKVTFNMNGHGSAIDAQNVLYKSKATQPSNPTASGYTFGGWYTDKNCTSAFDFNTEITDDKTLYAKWTANVITHTVTFGVHSSGNGTLIAKAGSTSINSGAKVNQGSSITFTADPSTGYEVAGWYSNSGCTSAIADAGTSTTYTISNLTAAATVYVKFQEEKYTVTLNNQSATTAGDASVQATYGSDMPSATMPTKTGYTFGGYYTSNNGGGTQYYTADGASARTWNIAENTTLYAKWTANQYTITWNPNGGTVEPTTSTYTYDGDPVALPTPKREGYTFNGWFTASSGGTQINDVGRDNKPTSNVTYYAHWAEILSTITIEINPEEGGIVKVDGQQFTSGQTVKVGVETSKQITLQANAGYGIAAFKQEGAAIIAGTGTYTLKADGSGNPGKLIANFTKNSYTFTLVQAEGGNATATVNGNAISSPATLEHGTQITLNATAADKYKFSKWVNNGTQVSTDNPYTHTLTANTTIQAVFTNTDILYLKPNENWKQNNAWFAACFCKTGSTDQYWVKMKNVDPCGGSDYYKAQIPDGGWDYVIFCRMDKDQHELKWDNRWDQSTNQTIPTDGKNCFSVDSGAWGGSTGATGTWKTYVAPHYEPVVFNVTVPAGTPNCYIIGDWDGWSQFTEMTKVDDTHYTVTIPDVCATSAKYKYCYGPSWGCEEVKNTNIPTEAIQDRTYHANDVVAAWISYYIVGYNGDWNTWNNGYKFDINGNLHVNLATVKEHEFKIKSSTQKLYTTENQDGNKHVFNRSHTSERITEKDGNWHALKLNVDVVGFYDFTYNPVSGLLTIAFPSKGYRLKITMTDDSGKVYTSNEVNNETETLSFFAPGFDDSKLSADITLEYQGSQRATIPSTSFKTSGVYTAKLNSNKDGITEPVLYNGNYYIRTDGAHGGWNSYKTNSDNKMTYFVPREEEKYSYYWVEALPRAARDHTNGVVNVKACVANEYNENLAVMLEADKFTDGYGNVEIKDPSDQKREKVNVRFGYNPKTNFFERAMLTGSGNTNTFLNITAPDYVYLDNDQTIKLTTADKNSKFTDVSNWVYQKDIWVKPPTTGASVYLTAEAYNEEVNSLFGFDKNGTPIARKIIGTNSGELRKMRTIYDFKTNRMIIAWVPDAQDITTEQSLEADVLFIRHENDEVPQLTFTPEEGQIKGIQSQFFALELENARDKNAEEHYWISLPFDCVVGSISGVPGYMEIWGIQRYNGEERAQKGWFKETSTFWEWLEPDDVMNAGEGYVLSFDKKAATWNDFDVHDDDGNLIGTESLLRLYFPSTTKGFEFKNSQPEREYVNQPCTITRDNRHLQDGNWKIIGPMSYNNVKATPTKYGAGDDVWKPEQDGDHVDVPEGEYKWSAPMFRYKYWEDESGNNWKYIPEDGTTNTYNSFFGYMVQFAGFIQWNSVSVSEPVLAGLTARRNTDTNERTNIMMRLEIVNAEGKQQDQTFVALDVEATTTFDPNKDLNKIFNDGETNIYSLSEGIPFAGNALPMEESVVPVGVQIVAEGEYTFRMPDGTEGMVVELIDYETNSRTNLLLSDYIVTLPKGTNENRFALHIQPQKDVVTSLENIGEGVNNGEAVNKYLIDGKLIIRTAEGVFDAQGHRL